MNKMSRRIDFIDFEEFTKLVKAEKDIDYKTAMILAYGSGLRISEIIGLKEVHSRCCDVGVVLKREEIKGKKVKRYYCLKCEKELNAKTLMSKVSYPWKIAPLGKDQVDLEKHQIRLDKAKGGKWRITCTSPALRTEMVNRLPLNIKRTTLQSHFKALSKRVLDKNLSFHILRHGFGNYQANVAKLPLPMVQQLMGHQRLDTTGIYTKANPEQTINEAWKGMGGK
jgi:integrase/recombinase XerD